MNKVFFIAATIFFVVSAAGQKKLPIFGEADATELALKACAFDPSAAAMKLFDIQDMEYEPSPFGGKIKTDKRVRIKIFTEKGFSSATITIPYYSNKKNTKIENLQAVIFNIDAAGKITKQALEEADFFKDKAMEKVGIIRFTFPNLQPGSVIEYSYTISEKNRLYFDNWVLQADIPTRYAFASVTIPTFSRIKDVLFGNDSITRKTEQLTKGLDREKKIYFKENISAFIPEPLMSSQKDNLLRLGFIFFPDSPISMEDMSPTSMWRLAGNMLLRSPQFDQLGKKEIPGTQKIIDTALSIIYSRDRIKYLFETVKKRFPDNTGQSGSIDEIDDIWKSRSATSAQINMILFNFLKRAQVKCHMLLISTRENGMINIDFPNFGQFNGMDIVAIDNESYYILDASIRHQPFDIPPLNILNRNAFLLDPDKIQWIKINDDRPLFKQNTDVFAMLTKEGVLEGSVSVRYFDYAKSAELDTVGKKNNKEGKFFDTNVQGLKILTEKKETEAADDSYLRSIEFDYEAPQSGDFCFINPQFLSTKKINPFTSDTRKTDIDFGSSQEFHLNMQLEVADNFTIETLPQNLMVRSPDSSFAYSRIVSATGANISFSQTININKALFDKKDYAGLYDFFSRISSLMAEEIILKRRK